MATTQQLPQPLVCERDVHVYTHVHECTVYMYNRLYLQYMYISIHLGEGGMKVSFDDLFSINEDDLLLTEGEGQNEIHVRVIFHHLILSLPLPLSPLIVSQDRTR